MSLEEIIIATKNRGKIDEFSALFDNYFNNITSLLDYESVPEIIEDRDTFEENALKKARIISDFFNKPVIADDSGLVVEVLDGEPGIYSARYAGEGSTDDQNVDKLLTRIKPHENRNAKFVCVLALVYPDGRNYIFEGSCEGLIIDEKRGSNGFGYDPVFYVPGLNKTMAELDPGVKNKISHRSEASKKLKDYLNSL